MAKIKTFGDAIVITSGLKVETIQALKMYNPKALILKDVETKQDKFRIDCATRDDCSMCCGAGDVSKNGILFTSKDNDGYAAITIGIPSNMSNDEKIECIKQQYGLILLTLNALETEIATAVANLDDDLLTIEDSIEIV